jgi:TNF receptor-associated protein 1
MEDAKSITEDEHTEFYRFITGQYDKPRYTLQYKIDVPINLRALIYIPQYKPSLFDDTSLIAKEFRFVHRYIRCHSRS